MRAHMDTKAIELSAIILSLCAVHITLFPDLGAAHIQHRLAERLSCAQLGKPSSSNLR